MVGTCGQDAHTPWGDPDAARPCECEDEGDFDGLTDWISTHSSTRTAHGTVRSSRFTVLLEEQAEA